MMRMTQVRRTVIWALLAMLAALICAAAFRGYLSADLLMNFTNWFYC